MNPCPTCNGRCCSKLEGTDWHDVPHGEPEAQHDCPDCMDGTKRSRFDRMVSKLPPLPHGLLMVGKTEMSKEDAAAALEKFKKEYPKAWEIYQKELN